MCEFRKLVIKYLRDLADKMDAGTTDITESQAVDILRVVAHEVMSKEVACNFLNLSRSRFDDLIRDGLIPKGRKRVGFRELIWFKDELEACKKK